MQRCARHAADAGAVGGVEDRGVVGGGGEDETVAEGVGGGDEGNGAWGGGEEGGDEVGELDLVGIGGCFDADFEGFCLVRGGFDGLG